jgi:isoprenylcysteine carboxyl methyltransferase (ICMT) family protein YpbQ
LTVSVSDLSSRLPSPPPYVAPQQALPDAPVLPASAAFQWINLTALAIMLATLFGLRALQWHDDTSALLIVMAAIATPVIALEWWVRARKAKPQPVSADAGRLVRVVTKLIGLAATFGAVAFLYWALPVYREGQLDSLIPLVSLLALPVAVIAPFYVWITDTRQEVPHDGCYMAGLFVLGRFSAVDFASLRQYALGWLIKAFFLPLMVADAAYDLRWFLVVDIGASVHASTYGWYEFLYRTFYFLEVTWAGTGYFLTLRLFDGHIRSAEPTLFGWLICVICYEPIWSMVSRSYLNYWTDTTWGGWLDGMPVLKMIWACAIIVLLTGFAWATMSFGIRFSNLTHRGILTNGPYRLTKHPGYLCKNISWWLIYVPFAGGADWADSLRLSLLLVGVNVIYYLRAKTEEWHLSRDPVYREYAAWIDEHGLFAKLKRFARLLLQQPESVRR